MATSAGPTLHPGEQVGRYRVEAFDFPDEWQPVHIGNNQIEFAWGPLGGGPATTVTAIEPGGRIHVTHPETGPAVVAGRCRP